MNDLATLFEPLYYAVIFTSKRRGGNEDEYSQMAARMEALAARQPGFLGLQSTRNTDGFGITVSYWQTLDAIRDWKANVEHREAQAMGRSEFYEAFHVRIARVERDYGFPAAPSHHAGNEVLRDKPAKL